ncbi:glycoside hydrolase family 3 C-terminal domain-containing protein [Bacillus sp. FJAT-50079]|uniref:beta-glucosidase family protein n=1 Tax=Bacillus sp. FJAT-50079 TaxID=2833577 RepID=UPI001BC9A7A4|nr:glycoside hydrolase family 3 C-terminal domain-containing protein [Bacillus sp. FJAT-50079]MBS4209410.1 glycoside hydrolase family 3 C-terminal domain-containing protein [Bacillus sp. FJAT-50079]
MNINESLSTLTLEEKISLLFGKGMWEIAGVSDIPDVMMVDGPHGVRKPLDINTTGVFEGNNPATAFPILGALASTWNPELAHEVGETLANECHHYDVHVLLAPGVNIKRTPLGGRNFEYLSEDPILAGEIASAYINGLQENGIGTSLKHYAANNSEFERMTISSEVDERTLREIYLTAFEIAIKKSNPWLVMTSYNLVNGYRSEENPHLMNQILRNEWNYNGVTISDWGAVTNRLKALQATLDIEMPGPSLSRQKQLVEQIRNGEVDEAVVDASVKRILELVMKAIKGKKLAKDACDFDQHHLVAKQVAVEGTVLLKNENAVLPIRKGKTKSILVLGKHAIDPRIGGKGGSAMVTPYRLDIPLEKMKEIAGDDITIHYLDGYDDFDPSKNKMNQQEAIALAKQVDKVIIFAGIPEELEEAEGFDKEVTELPQSQIDLILAIVQEQANTAVVLSNGSPLTMTSWVDQVPALVEGWFAGQAGGSAIADILFGLANPSGKLSETFPEHISHNPAHLTYPGENGKVHYREGIFVGYRYYDKKNIKPLFPFGHGLSYTEFTYESIQVNKEAINDTETVEVTVMIRNNGLMAGKEVVQLYVSDQGSRVIRPLKELKKFEKVDLQPGEAKQITFKLAKRDFSYYDVGSQGWHVETGLFNLLVGSSVADIRLSTTIHVTSTEVRNPMLTRKSLTKEWLQDENGKKIIVNFFDQLSDELNMEDPYTLSFLKECPIPAVISLFGQKWMDENDADAVLDQLLAQVNQVNETAKGGLLNG